MSIKAESDRILAGGRITNNDVLGLRRQVYAKPHVVPAEAEILLSLNARLGAKAEPEWPRLFVESLTDYLVHQAKPHGYIDEKKAKWLIERISQPGRVHGATELELLIRLMECATSSPIELVTFALEQVRWAVVNGEGCIGEGRTLRAGVIGQTEVELVRRILYAFGGDGNIGVTRQEASVLFDINDATAEADNDPSWSDLFVKAVANFLLVASGYQPPSREEALRREAWLDAPSDGIAQFMSRMLVDSLEAVVTEYRPPHGSETALRRFELMLDKKLPEQNLAWLATRIGHDEGLHENERALLTFLKAQGDRLHLKIDAIDDGRYAA